MKGSARSACCVAHSIHALYFVCFSADHEIFPFSPGRVRVDAKSQLASRFVRDRFIIIPAIGWVGHAGSGNSSPLSGIQTARGSRVQNW